MADRYEDNPQEKSPDQRPPQHDHDNNDKKDRDYDHHHDHNKKRDCNCEEGEGNSPTRKSIKNELNKLCVDLYIAKGEVVQFEKRFDSISEREGYKRCSYSWSEEYYHYYRDLNLGYGSKLLQSADSIKDRVTKNIASSNELTSALEEIIKSTRDLKTKVLDLSKASDDLKWATKDPCNKAAMTIITGKPQEGCKDQQPVPEPVKGCEQADEIFSKLIRWPHTLAEDVVRLIKSSADVKGIQAFSIVSSLDELQKKLNEDAKIFDKHIQDNIKKGETAVKNSYTALSSVAQELAKADVDRYTKRSVFEGLVDATRDVCCYHCDCLKDDSCHERICKICKAILPDKVNQQPQQQQ